MEEYISDKQYLLIRSMNKSNIYEGSERFSGDHMLEINKVISYKEFFNRSWMKLLALT